MVHERHRGCVLEFHCCEGPAWWECWGTAGRTGHWGQANITKTLPAAACAPVAGTASAVCLQRVRAACPQLCSMQLSRNSMACFTLSLARAQHRPPAHSLSMFPTEPVTLPFVRDPSPVAKCCLAPGWGFGWRHEEVCPKLPQGCTMPAKWAKHRFSLPSPEGG